jgi:D-3-phosphoglycerate dehydrogenase
MLPVGIGKAGRLPECVRYARSGRPGLPTGTRRREAREEPMASQLQVVQAGIYPHRVEPMIAWTRRAVEDAGYGYTFLRTLAGPEADQALASADAVIAVIGERWDAEQFGRLERCRLFVSPGVGLDAVDLEAAAGLGIAVVNQPESCTDEVADHTFALILSCVRKVPWLSARVKGGTWDRTLFEPMMRLRGRTLGLVAFGRIGRAVARRASGFGLRTIAYDPYVDPAHAEALGVELVSLDRVFTESDIVSCVAPLTSETRGMLGERQFGQMRTGAIFTNTSRGAIVDENDLLWALDSGRLAAAGIDVLGHEPADPHHPLFSRDNVIVTPHAAGFSDQVVDDLQRLAVEEIVTVFRGGLPTEIAWATHALRPDGGRIEAARRNA